MAPTVEHMQALLARQWEKREEERRWLAREIHSTLAQDLTVLSMELSLLQRRLSGSGEKPSGFDTAALRSTVRELSDVVRRTIEWTKWVKNRLRPKVLDECGLGAAAEWRAGEFERETGVVCTVVVEPETIDVETGLATDCFRILEELLSNVARHARASRVQVRIRGTGSELAMEVEDNGCGISDEAIRALQSLGLAEICERARRWGGAVEIARTSGGGTIVKTRLPLADAAPGSGGGQTGPTS